MSKSSKNSVAALIIIIGLIIIAALLYFFVFSNSAKFTKLINKADEEYAANKLEEAKGLYREATDIKPEESYPKNRIATIDSIINVRVLMGRYQEKIKTADDLFEQKKYVQAREYYFEALNMNSDDDYPVNQIKRIEELLAAPEPANKQKEIAPGKNFHVIVGVFETEENAIKFNEELRKEGKESSIIPRDVLNMNAVSYGSYEDIHEAYNILRMVQIDLNKDAWVLFYKAK